MRTVIELKALDTLFFRDGKPFYKGEETWATGTFPPSPSVFYGALRTAYFANNMADFPKANTDNDPTQKLEIKGIYLKINTKGYYYFFPLPLDLVQEKNKDTTEKNKEESEKTYKVVHLQMNEEKAICSNPMQMNKEKAICSNPNLARLSADEEVKALEDGVIEKTDLQDYLNSCQDGDLRVRKLDDFIKKEPKIGIGRENSSHTTEEGLLYRVGMVRMQDSSFIVEFEGLKLPDNGFLKLGGEGKAVSYSSKDIKPVVIEAPSITNNLFKLYLLTPAIFTHGWLPSWIDEKTLTGAYKGIKLTLLTAAIGKPQNIGGFDMQNRFPKPMRKAVPAGSVYYFKTEETDKQKLIKTFHGQSISDDKAKEGFGVTLIGGVNQ